jgi:hypothetical protein
VAWNVAGAIVEFALDDDETDALLAALARRGCPVDRDLLAFLRPCYLAQQVGLWSLSLDQHPDERTASCWRRYRRRLATELDPNAPAHV